MFNIDDNQKDSNKLNVITYQTRINNKKLWSIICGLQHNITFCVAFYAACYSKNTFVVCDKYFFMSHFKYNISFWNIYVLECSK